VPSWVQTTKETDYNVLNLSSLLPNNSYHELWAQSLLPIMYLYTNDKPVVAKSQETTQQCSPESPAYNKPFAYCLPTLFAVTLRHQQLVRYTFFQILKFLHRQGDLTLVN